MKVPHSWRRECGHVCTHTPRVTEWEGVRVKPGSSISYLGDWLIEFTSLTLIVCTWQMKRAVLLPFEFIKVINVVTITLDYVLGLQ